MKEIKKLVSDANKLRYTHAIAKFLNQKRMDLICENVVATLVLIDCHNRAERKAFVRQLRINRSLIRFCNYIASQAVELLRK
jgi:hypothetical protein